MDYVRAATKLELHQLVLEAFDESGISQATLAKRLKKRPEQVSRLLAGPGNWTIDTFAELLFAIDGSLSRVERRSPMPAERTNNITTNGVVILRPEVDAESRTKETFTSVTFAVERWAEA